jgi:hypothetical protein
METVLGRGRTRGVRVGLLTSSPLHLRMRRVLAAHPSIERVDLATNPEGFDLFVTDRTIPTNVPNVFIPSQPLEWLADQLANMVSEPIDRSYTTLGPPLHSGTATQFPKPIGSVWARAKDGFLVAPVEGSLAGASARGDITIGVTDNREFLTALAAMGPALQHITGASGLTSLQGAGLQLASVN